MIVINNENVIHHFKLFFRWTLSLKNRLSNVPTFRQHRPGQCSHIWIRRIGGPQEFLARVLLSEPAPHHSTKKDIVGVHSVFSCDPLLHSLTAIQLPMAAIYNSCASANRLTAVSKY
jgi:hypothetical protein